MHKKIQCLFVLLGVIGLLYPQHSQAIFCSARKFVHPVSGNQRWLLGDIHVDIDPQGTLTRLQQHIVLEQAQHMNALIIAENVSMAGYSPYPWACLLAAQACAVCYFVKNKNRVAFNITWALGCVTGASWYMNWFFARLATQKPAFTIKEYLAALKQYPETTTLHFHGYTPLKRLVEEAKDRGIAARDLEFRYHMVGACTENVRRQLPWYQQLPYLKAHVLAWAMRTLTGNRVRYPMTLDDYCRVNDTIVHNINSFHDTPKLQQFYGSCVHNYQTSWMHQELRAIARTNPHRSLATIVPDLMQKSDQDGKVVFHDFIEHNKDLLDALIMHEVYNSQSIKTVFVCAGVAHTDRIAPILEALGYQEVCTYGTGSCKKLQELGILGATTMQVKDLDSVVVDLQMVFAQHG